MISLNDQVFIQVLVVIDKLSGVPLIISHRLLALDFLVLMHAEIGQWSAFLG